MQAKTLVRVKQTAAAEKMRRSLRYSIYEGSAYNVMVGFGDSYLTPFALRLGAGSAAVGMLASIPTLVGSMVQPVGAFLSEAMHSRKAVLLPAVFGHAFMWIPILAIPFLPSLLPSTAGLEVPLLIAFLTLGVVFHALGGPAWVSLIGDLVPKKERGKYFGIRNEIIGFVGLASLLTAGFILNLCPSQDIFLGFALLFAVAFLARIISLTFLKMHFEPTAPSKPAKSVTLSSFIKEIVEGRKPVARFAFFLCATKFAVSLASPFYAVYMLRDLGFDYITFAALGAVQAFSTYLAMPHWGRLSDKYGNRVVICTTAFLVALAPFLWLPSQRISYLALVHVFNGFACAGFDLAAFNYILDSTAREKRVEYTANINLTSGFAVFGGALAGGFLATGFESMQLLWLAGFPALFFVSGVARGVCALVLSRGIEEVRVRQSIHERKFFWRALVIYPTHNVTHALVWSWIHTKAVVHLTARHVARELPLEETLKWIKKVRKKRR